MTLKECAQEGASERTSDIGILRTGRAPSIILSFNLSPSKSKSNKIHHQNRNTKTVRTVDM